MGAELKKASSRQYTTNLNIPSDSQLIVGCLQRIADSLESLDKKFQPSLIDQTIAIQDLEKEIKKIKIAILKDL